MDSFQLSFRSELVKNLSPISLLGSGFLPEFNQTVASLRPCLELYAHTELISEGLNKSRVSLVCKLMPCGLDC